MVKVEPYNGTLDDVAGTKGKIIPGHTIAEIVEIDRRCEKL